MNATSVKVCAAGLFLITLAAGSCNGGSGPSGGPVTPADRAALDAAMTGERTNEWVDDRMKFLEDYVLARARHGDSGSFPSYNAWLGALASSVSSGTSAPGENDHRVQLAESELAPHKRPLEETHDVSLMAAYEEGTRLGLLGRRLVEDFRERPQNVRATAAGRLRDRYRLP